MFELLWLPLTTVLVSMRPRQDLVLENLLLRRQLAVLACPTRARPRARVRAWDKLLWMLARRVCGRWREHLAFVTPRTRSCVGIDKAAAALALALHLGPHALASLRVGEITSSGTALELHHGERCAVPPDASAVVRAQLIQGRDHGAGDDDALFCRRGGTPASEATLRRLLQQVSCRLAIAIPPAISPVAAGVSWPVGNRLTLSRLPVFPLPAR